MNVCGGSTHCRSCLVLPKFLYLSRHLYLLSLRSWQRKIDTIRILRSNLTESRFRHRVHHRFRRHSAEASPCCILSNTSKQCNSSVKYKSKTLAAQLRIGEKQCASTTSCGPLPQKMTWLKVGIWFKKRDQQSGVHVFDDNIRAYDRCPGLVRNNARERRPCQLRVHLERK